MPSVQQHYDQHLGPVYGWMLGDFGAAVASARAELEAAGVGAGAGARAVDLGAGNGASALALADLGYDVVAVDTCATLLDELRTRAAGRAVRPVLGDAAALHSLWSAPAAAVTCLGDTLTHLHSLGTVERLLQDAASALAPGGTFVATFRDYTGPAPQGAARFIPVRADDQRILTCFLDYQDGVVLVHDILHERRGATWDMRVSAYPKLRLSPGAARALLTRAGLEASLEPAARGMVRLTGRKPGGTGRQPCPDRAGARARPDTSTIRVSTITGSRHG